MGHVIAVAGRTLIRPFVTTASSAVNTQSISLIYLLNKYSICSNLTPVNLKSWAESLEVLESRDPIYPPYEVVVWSKSLRDKEGDVNLRKPDL